MAFRNLFTRGLFQLVKSQRSYSAIQQCSFLRRPMVNTQQYRFTSTAKVDEVYKDLNKFLEKEIQLEKNALKTPNKVPTIPGFEVQSEGPEITLTRQSGKEKIVVRFNVTNTVNAAESDQGLDSEAIDRQKKTGELPPASSQLKSRPTFTVDINRGGQTLSFLCSYLPDNYPDPTEQSQGGENENSEDFQIDEFAIHDGDWNDSVYSADCAVIDGDLYDKLLNLLEEHGIGEDFANQLAEFSTTYEHGQYIGLLENLKKFSTK